MVLNITALAYTVQYLGGFSTQIKLFLEMLKFSQIVFLKRPKFLVKENQESFEMF
jgi:hypothetical protein